MEFYDVFHVGNFMALKEFKNTFGILDYATGQYVIATKWQLSLQVSVSLAS
jgi:hypothetical protein